MPAKIIQIVPDIRRDLHAMAGLIGLDESGEVWYGRFAEEWRSDGGPAEVTWRPIKSKMF